MLMEVRGGIAYNRRVAVDGTGAAYPASRLGGMPTGVTKYIALQNEGTVAVRVAFSAAEMAAGQYFTLFANTDTAGRDRWQGPVELADDCDGIYLQTAGLAATVTITYFQRRG